MSFFNDKEEVLTVELTQEGKRLLAEGRFKPSFYSFGDDDILYDTNYAALTESQNAAETRIFDEVPRSKPQYNYSGVETELMRFRDRTVSNQSEMEKSYTTLTSLGTSSPSSDKMPAWNIKFLEGALSGSEEVVSGSYSKNIRIPQLHGKSVEYGVNILKGIPNSVKDHLRSSTVLNNGINNFEFNDGSLVEVDEAQIVLEVEELNSLFREENFEMEIFLVEDNTTTTALSSSSGEVLVPLFFPDLGEPEGNILKDEVNPLRFEEETTPDMVGYYLNVETDYDIDPRILCKLIPIEKRRGIYGSRFVECTERESVNLIDVYDSDLEEEEDPC